MVTLNDVRRSEFLVFISKDTAFQVRLYKTSSLLYFLPVSEGKWW